MGIIVLSFIFAFIKSISVELMQKIIYHIEPEVLVMISSFEDDTGIIEGLVNRKFQFPDNYFNFSC